MHAVPKALVAAVLLTAGCGEREEPEPPPPQPTTGEVCGRIVNESGALREFDAEWVAFPEGRYTRVLTRHPVPAGASHSFCYFSGNYGTRGEVNVSAWAASSEGPGFWASNALAFTIDSPKRVGVFRFRGASNMPAAWAAE